MYKINGLIFHLIIDVFPYWHEFDLHIPFGHEFALLKCQLIYSPTHRFLIGGTIHFSFVKGKFFLLISPPQILKKYFKPLRLFISNLDAKILDSLEISFVSFFFVIIMS